MTRFKRALLVLACAIGITTAAAQSFEVGYHYDYRGHAAFAYVTHDFSMGHLGSIGLWFSPSLEVIISPTYLDGWLQAQFLVDAPAATLSIRAKYELIDSRRRGELRVGLLLGN